MKKIILILMMIFISLPCMAYENYMLMADHQISNIEIGNEEIITVEPVVSLKCDEYAMMIIPHSEGVTRLTFCKGKRRICLTVKVYPDKTCIKKVNGIQLIPVDLPPELKDQG